MQKTFCQYHLTTELAKKYSHSTYLASPSNEPEHEVVLIVFASSLFRFPYESENLLQKVQRIKKLQQPHLLPILDMGIEQDQPFVVRAYLPNGSLRSRLKKLAPHRLELQKALSIILQVGETLAYAHGYNIVHGNIKPENILFDANNQPVLTDFTFVSRKDAIIRDQVTEEYAFCYMAPEQFAGTCNTQSDQYSLGSLAYELITGHVPFAAQSLASMMGQHPHNTSPAPLSENIPDLPPTLEAAVLKTLARDPAERFFDLSLFLEVMRCIVSPPPAFPLTRFAYSYENKQNSHPIQPEDKEGIFHINKPLANHVTLQPSELVKTIPITEEETDDLLLTNPFREEETDISSMRTSASFLDWQDERAGQLARDRTGLKRPSRKRVLWLAFFISLIVASFACGTFVPSKLIQPEVALHPVRVSKQVITPNINSILSALPSPQASSAAIALLSPQATLTAIALASVQATNVPLVQPPTPTPTVIATPGTSYEAEASGNTRIGTKVVSCSGCSGKKRVSDIFQDASLQFNNVSEMSAGNYKLSIYYLDLDNTSLFMSVNGEPGIVFNVVKTPDRNTPQIFNIIISLKASNNTIKFYNPSATDLSGDFSVDRIVV